MHPTAAQSLLVRRTPAVGLFVAASVVGHVGVLALAILWGAFHRAPPLDLDQKPIKASLVRLGKPREKRLLPRKEEQPPPPKEVKAPEKVAPPKPEKPAEKVPIPGVKPEPSKVAKQEGKKDGDASRKQLFGAFNKVAAKAEDLEGAEDGDPYGDSAVQEGERYFGAIKAQVRRYYDVSNTLSEQQRMYLRANVFFRIDRKGALLEVKLAKSSGNDLFDGAVVAAVKKAAPFGPPPEHLRQKLEDEGFIVEFSP